jgi:hydroxymethylglutaryl-CoA lyase
MASDALVGNMPTEKLLTFFSEKGVNTGIHLIRFESAMNQGKKLFTKYF